MKAVRSFLLQFRDSPTLDRDRANIVSSSTIGITALLLNAAVLFFVLPLLLNSNDTDFQQLTQNIEFGQLLGLILPGGAAVFATLLIPLRLANVLMAPRIGRYFDQIVLSGIAPLRFLIGKVLSQNYLLALIAVLLVPWLVLVLALGGLNWSVFIANLFLVWLYCMMLSLVMLWLSLYMNEVVAAFVMIDASACAFGFGCIPIAPQPFIVTPAPALMHSIYMAFGVEEVLAGPGYFATFASCAVGMSGVSLIALLQIYFGPLFGIIRENSTFGEVVKAGDSRRKRRLKFRLHIQRPSELAFFYENRSTALRSVEGFFRWSVALLSVLVPAAVAWGTMFMAYKAYYRILAPALVAVDPGSRFRRLCDWHISLHVIHAVTLILASFVFSHGRNTTLLRLPVLFGRSVMVSRLDLAGFLIVSTLSVCVTLGMPGWLDQAVAATPESSLLAAYEFADFAVKMDFADINITGTLVLMTAGLTLYGIQRLLCLTLWLKSMAFGFSAALYGGFVCIVPLMIGIVAHEFDRFNEVGLFADIARGISLVSPITVIVELYDGFGSGFYTHGMSRMPFFFLHGAIILGCLMLCRSRSRLLSREYLAQKS